MSYASFYERINQNKSEVYIEIKEWKWKKNRKNESSKEMKGTKEREKTKKGRNGSAEEGKEWMKEGQCRHKK